MHSEQRIKNQRRQRRRNSVRRRLGGYGKPPRLSVHRSSKHIYAQVIDDDAGQTLAAVGTVGKALGDSLGGKNKTEKAAAVGAEIARLATEKGIQSVVFDRGHCRYHGRVKALADAAREGGLRF